MLSNILTVATLVALSAAAPMVNSGDSPVKARGIGEPTPANIPLPPAGQCALVVISGSDMGLGGAPTSASGEGVGASASGGEPLAGVINTYGDTVGEYVILNTDSPGFDAYIDITSSDIVNAQDVTMTANGMIAPASRDWGIKYYYNNVNYDCKDGGCKYTEVSKNAISTRTAFTGNFAC